MNTHRALSAEHQAALSWFRDRSGQVISWPGPLNGMFLVNRAKGIHKPSGWQYALSVRQSLDGPYEDAFDVTDGNRWVVRYAFEGTNPDYFTNRALRACMADAVPVGVIIQTQQKPESRYRVLGLGLVVAESAGVFTIEQAGGTMGEASTDPALSVSLPSSAFDPSTIEDAREKILRAIALRRGQPAFRRALLEAYERTCAVSGCNVASVLEAAHIVPYLGGQTNLVCNGILLRADIHTLFDLGLVWVDPSALEVRVHTSIEHTGYGTLHGRLIRLPKNPQDRPSKEALLTRVPSSVLK